MRTCVGCGTPVPVNDSFCRRCGTPLAPYVHPQVQQPPHPPLPQQGPGTQPAGFPAAPTQAPSASAYPAAFPDHGYPHGPMGTPPPVAAAEAGSPGPVGPARRPWLGRLAALGVGLAAVAIAVVITATLVSPKSAPTFEGRGFATADAAVEGYLDAMRKSDLDGMLSSFAVETYAEHYDLRARIARLQAYQPYFDLPLPGGELNTELNVHSRLARTSNAILVQYQVLSEPDFDLTTVIPLPEGTDVDAFYADLAATFDGSAFDRIRDATPIELATFSPDIAELYNQPQNQENIEASRKMIGADEVAHRVVRIETDRSTFHLFFELVRYRDTWWVGELGGNVAILAGVPAYSGGLLKA